MGVSRFRVIVIVEGSREWSRAGGGGGAWADGGLLAAVGTEERGEREELEEENLLFKRKE